MKPESPKINGPRIMGTIDLEALNPANRKKAAKPEPEEDKPAPAPQEPKPVAEAKPEPKPQPAPEPKAAVKEEAPHNPRRSPKSPQPK